MSGVADIAVQPKLSAKDGVRPLLDRLPDDVTLEDIQYHLDVVVNVLEAEADTSGDIPHEEVFKPFEEEWREAGLVSREGFTEEDCNRRFGSGWSASKAGR
jgi:hypothetical protein